MKQGMYALAALMTAMLMISNGQATTYTFQPSSGDWNEQGNWSPQGTPASGDTAVIPSGRTCTVAAADQEIQTLDVDGTLEVIERTLTIGAGAGSAVTHTLNGELKLTNDEFPAKLVLISVDSTFQADEGETGQITGVRVGANPADGGGGRIRLYYYDVPRTITIGSRVSIGGKLVCETDVYNEGEVLADDSSDDITFDGAVYASILGGPSTGKCTASSGVVKFGAKTKYSSDNTQWIINGGRVEVSSSIGESYPSGL